MTYDEMRLRDHFAGLAMQARLLSSDLVSVLEDVIITTNDGDAGEDAPDDRVTRVFVDWRTQRPEDVASAAYDYADAMLKARQATEATS